MSKRILATVVCVAVLLSLATALSAATERGPSPRETPLVRAIKRAKSSVVNIHSEKTTYNGDALFPAGRGRKVNGMGTGIVIDLRGYVVTNYHVVHGVDALRVTLVNGETYEARTISYDRRQDLAIIKIDASEPLNVMPLGTSSDLMLGETVIAVGNAYGYEHTITSGIVSALSRDVEVNETQSYEDLIQTDASINPGNSGGPLLNLEGEVVGINVAIRAGAQRIGFAIPIDDARKIIAKLLSVEQLDNTYHGVSGRDVKQGKERKFIVEAVDHNSPAEHAGLKSGDVVVKAGDINVIDSADFERALLGREAGEIVNLTVQRKNKTEVLDLTLMEREIPIASNSRAGFESESVVRANMETVAEKTWRMLGLRLAELSNRAMSLSGTRYRGGIRVEAVRPGSVAQQNGIRRGDILVGLHVWETVSEDNVAYVLDHPKLDNFLPLKFYLVRGRDTLFGHLDLGRGGR